MLFYKIKFKIIIKNTKVNIKFKKMYKIKKSRVNKDKNNINIKVTRKEKELTADKIKVKHSSNLPRKFGQDITNIPKQIQTQNSKLIKTRIIYRKSSSYNKKSQNKKNPNNNTRNKKIFPNRIVKAVTNDRNSFDKTQNINLNYLSNNSNLNNCNYYSKNINNSLNFRSSIQTENNNISINKDFKNNITIDNNTFDNNWYEKRKQYKILPKRNQTNILNSDIINYIFHNNNNKLLHSKNKSISNNNFQLTRNSYQFNSFQNSSFKNSSSLKKSTNNYCSLEGNNDIITQNKIIKSLDKNKIKRYLKNKQNKKVKELSQDIKKVKKFEYMNKKFFTFTNNNNNDHTIEIHPNLTLNQNNIKKEKKYSYIENSNMNEINSKGDHKNKILKPRTKLSLDLNSKHDYIHIRIGNNKENKNKHKKNKIPTTTRNTTITNTKTNTNINTNLSINTYQNTNPNTNSITIKSTNTNPNTNTNSNININSSIYAKISNIQKLKQSKMYNRRTKTNYDIKSILQIEKVKTKKKLTNKKTLIHEEINNNSSFSLLSSESSENLPKYVDITNINDPQIPKEYLNIIYYNLLIEEKKGIINKPYYDFMKKQKKINDQMRSILIDWIIDVHYKFGFTDETLFMTVLTIDRYLTINPIKKNDLQLLGITALMIACKHEEIDLPKSDDFIYITDNAYTKEQLFKMENQILSAINFCLLYPSPIKFFEYLSQNFNFNKKMHFMGKYLMESFLLDVKYVKYNASIISCACAYIVMKLFQNPRYRESYEKKYYLINENEEVKIGHGVKDCAQDICFLIDNISDTNFKSCYNKYSSEKLEKVSRYIEEK